MHYLSLSYLNLLPIKNCISLLFCLFLFACSSTEQVNNNYFSDNGYVRGVVSNNFHNQFTPTNRNSIKKELPADYQLMMSLLNRPITTDHAMMLAFAQERASYNIYGVEIKGVKSSSESNYRSVNAYTSLLSQDINAVNISAPN